MFQTNCQDAKKYVEYILGCIKAKGAFSFSFTDFPARSHTHACLILHISHTFLHPSELFGVVRVEPVTYWEHLVWMDTANFGGVQEWQPHAVRVAESKPTTPVVKAKVAKVQKPKRRRKGARTCLFVCLFGCVFVNFVVMICSVVPH